MTLAEVRELVLAETGRLDTETKRVGNTTMLDFYINEASRYLDLRPEVDRVITNYRGVVQPGEMSPSLTLCRSVESVWRLSTDATWQQLCKMEMADLIRCYPKLEESDRGIPLYWTPHTLSKFGVTMSDEVGLRLFDTGYDLYGFSLLPPPSVNTILSVYGLFHAPLLVGGEDQNYWSANHPKLLSLAVGWCLESANRNREGMLDFEVAMSTYMTGIRFDKVSQDIAGGVRKDVYRI